MVDGKEVAEFTASISSSAQKADLETYRLPVTINNRSSVGFQKAEVAVKDEGSGQVYTCYFGAIGVGASAREYADLPGGIEVCIWKILPDIGDEIYGVGMANNASGVNLTITD